MTTNLPVKLEHLPKILPLDGAVRIELVEGILIFRASATVIERIETLIARGRESSLTEDEENELDGYGELDDYLSFVNRIIRARNLSRISHKVLGKRGQKLPKCILQNNLSGLKHDPQ